MIEEFNETEGLAVRKIKVKEEIWIIWTVYCNKNMGNMARIMDEKMG